MELLKFDHSQSATPEILNRSARILAEVICTRLAAYPHYAVLRGSAATADHAWAKTLCRAIAALTPQKAGPKGVGALSITLVRVDAAEAGKTDDITRYSRTNQQMAPHTDSSYLADPHELVAFQLVAADSEGGATTVVPIENVVAKLSPGTAERLRDAVYPFGRGELPILFGDAQSPRIRYYRAQIDLAVAAGARLSTKAKDALDELDSLLAEDSQTIQFRLREGDILFLSNQMALHGRTGFSSESRRQLLRLRTYVGRLA